MQLSVVILAAGQGKRMNSDLPKVLQPLAGEPLLQHVISAARALNPSNIYVVYGHGGAQVQAALHEEPVEWVLQAEQLGTGHAVMQAMCRHSGRAHGAGAVRRCAADQRRLPREVDRAPRMRARSPYCRSISTKRMAMGASCATPTARSLRSSSTAMRAQRSCRFARSIQVSWRRRQDACASGCWGWEGTTPSANTS